MRKLILTVIMAMEAFCTFGGFSVTQYNLNQEVLTISQAESAINNHSTWLSVPVTHTYDIIAFANDLLPRDAVHFSERMVAFPESLMEHGAFVLRIAGYINIPEVGDWTFACGSDDGFKATISGHGISKTFSFLDKRSFDTSIKKFNFDVAEKYKLEIIYFNKGYWGGVRPSDNHAGLEFSVAKGNHSSFSSAFKLVGTEASEIVLADDNVVVHFDANGGVFRDKDGNEMTRFDQHFTYGEAQRLFTDELTPMKMDANGNQFVGWVCESPEVTTGTSIVAAREERTWYEHDGVTEVTYYAVWTTTVTVSFYNDTDVNSGNRILSPGSLGSHLSWSVDADIRRYKSGESVQVLPGQRIIRLYVDDEYHWIAGRFDLGIDEPYFNRAYDYLELSIGNDFSDVLVYGSTPREYVHRIYVKVEPDINQPETHGDVVFFYSAAVREELRNLINAQRGNVPSFDISKVRISIGRTEVNQSGIVVWDSAHGLAGLELHKYYCLPTGFYYLKDVVYDADTSSGDPYWGALLGSTFENQLIEVKDGKTTERTINFDVFGGADVVRAVFDPRDGRCTKSEMWFAYHGLPNLSTGWMFIDNAMAESLPKVEDRTGFRFMGWFTKESGGLELKKGSTIPSDKVQWNLPFDYTFKVYAQWTDMTDKWVNELFPNLVFDQNGSLVTLAKTTAANGKLTVAQCYSCGVNPTDPNDDLKITNFEMKDGKPVITLNHTEDGSGNSFMPRVKTLGKTTLSNTEEWREVPEEGDPTMRFFKVEVEMP